MSVSNAYTHDLGGGVLPPLPTGIILAATPLGNIGDASPRLAQALAQADYIASEDTRRTRSLAQTLGVEITGQVLSNFDHNEHSRVQQLLDHARHGCVVVVSDAGMPIISDPGFPLVEAAHDAGIAVSCIPGPSAVPVALALSGLHVGKFAFDGFAPRKGGPRREWLESLKTEERAVCFFESPHRISDTLAEACEILGPTRRAAIARELTKRFEQVQRGSLAELSKLAAEGLKGEITCVIEGVDKAATADVADIVQQVIARVETGERLKTVCAELAARHGLSKKELYDATLQQR